MDRTLSIAEGGNFNNYIEILLKPYARKGAPPVGAEICLIACFPHIPYELERVICAGKHPELHTPR